MLKQAIVARPSGALLTLEAARLAFSAILRVATAVDVAGSRLKQVRSAAQMVLALRIPTIPLRARLVVMSGVIGTSVLTIPSAALHRLPTTSSAAPQVALASLTIHSSIEICVSHHHHHRRP